MSEKAVSELWLRLREATPDKEESERSPYFEKLCGVSQASVSRWRTGENQPTLTNAEKISRDTGYCIQYLLAGNGPTRWNLRDVDADRLLDILDSANPEDKADILRYAEFRTAGT